MKYLSYILLAFLFSAVPVIGQRDVSSVSDKLFDLRKEGKYEEAISELNNLININPNYPKLYIKRAEFFGLQKKFEEAIADVNAAIAIEPDNAMFYLGRAKYFKLTNNNKAVLNDVQTALSLDPNKLMYGEKELSLIGQYGELIKIADSYIARNKLKYWAYRIRSENKFLLKDYVGALEDSILAIELINIRGDQDTSAFTYGGEIDRLPLFDKVILPATNEHLRNDDKIFIYYYRLFDVFERKAKEVIENPLPIFEGWRERYIEVAEARTASFQSKLRRLMISCAELYFEKGHAEKADEVLNRLVKTNPETFSYRSRAGFYMRRGRYQEAIDDLTYLVRIGKTSKDILFERGDLYVLTKQYDKAIEDYERAKSLYKGVETEAIMKIDVAKQKMLENGSQPK
jgi:tetratricopeptide (TPR) repeat protein